MIERQFAKISQRQARSWIYRGNILHHLEFLLVMLYWENVQWIYRRP